MAVRGASEKGKVKKPGSKGQKKTTKRPNTAGKDGQSVPANKRVKRNAWNTGDKLVGLDSNKYSKIKQEFFDTDIQEYLSSLSDKDREWLAQFMKEWLGANTTNAKFHKSKKDRKKVYNANNARNRDIYSNQRATGRFVDYEKIRQTIDELYASGNYEDDLIDYIDSKKATKN